MLKKEDAELLYNFGKHIGIAFQIMDDYLDVFCNVEQFGKNTLVIFMKTKTVLYLLAMEHANESREKKNSIFGILKN